ncbi:MAG: hypothetical protein KUG82_06155 [Pseudomonadales bacterium]|nr:hypothetical protein [Pseudomonadales bacterium]
MIYVAYFFIGAFFVNSIPHIVHGVSGSKFQSPFAKPPGVGESSAVVNVLWGAFNFIAAYIWLSYLGFCEIGLNACTIALVCGGLVTGITLAIHFGRVRNP